MSKNGRNKKYSHVFVTLWTEVGNENRKFLWPEIGRLSVNLGIYSTLPEGNKFYSLGLKNRKEKNLKRSLFNNIRRSAGLIFEVKQLMLFVWLPWPYKTKFSCICSALTYESTVLLLSPVNTKLSFKLKHYNSLQCLAGHYPFDLIT